MKITFPHMGNTYIGVKVLLDSIGIEYVIPPLCNKKALENGIKHSPEFICLPFKTMLGDFIYGLENGAEVIMNGASCGQCRQGYYGDLFQEILRSIGYEHKYININLHEMSFDNFYDNLRPYAKNLSKFKIIKAMILAALTVLSVDKLFEAANHIRCKETKIGSVDEEIKRFRDKVHKAKGYIKISKLISSTRKKIKLIAKNNKHKKSLKVVIIGEIFIASEPFTNLEIERRLGNLGVDVYNTMSVGMWIREHFIHNLIPFKRKNKVTEAAQTLIHTDDIGGHGVDTVGTAILYSQKGYDGIIHVYPFTCMPEIIAQSAFSTIQEQYGVPIMTLILDELTGEIGYQTRLEAFVDMMEMRKQMKLSGLGDGDYKLQV
jgi:predicted nucleotide-binding protein (sugar kinase/HSP70/actin superfamily)